MTKLRVGEVLDNAGKSEKSEKDERMSLVLSGSEVSDATSSARAQKHEKERDGEVWRFKFEVHGFAVDAEDAHEKGSLSNSAANEV